MQNNSLKTEPIREDTSGMSHKLKVQYWPIDDVHPYPNNPRNNDEAVEYVANSIREFSFQQPLVVDTDGTIIAGHTRLKAAKMLGMETVPVVVADNLTPAQVNAYRLADNKVAEAATWDMEALAVELEGLEVDFDMTMFDFDASEFNFGGLGGEPTDIVEDEVPEDAPSIVQKGDVWQLGRHRLMCGDSTDHAVVDMLMDGVKADMVFTDPPYNIGYQGVSDKRTIQNDKMGDERFVEFLKSSLMNCETMYVCCSWQNAHLFRRAIEENGNKIKAMIVWDKVNPAQHLDKYFKQHEIIWYCGKFGGEKTLRGDIWQVKRQANTVHPTMKPIELIAMALQDNPDKKIVYDGFGGSGSTLIACEQLNRTCYMMELDPHYCDIIIERWQNLTGETARKVM